MKVAHVEEFYICPCNQCGVRFGLPIDLTNARQADKGTFYCPNGHPLSWRESEADKLRRERDRLKQNAAQLQDSIDFQRDRADAAERRASAARGQVTKLKKRAAAGVCPCCNRQFVNLQGHMASKHSGFAAEEVAPQGATIQ